MSENHVRVRFAPSPTGHVHIGNIRTAIFNWLFARHSGAEFLLRVEDTDRERSTQEAIKTLLECMDWLGLSYDGEILYQSSMLESHRAAAKKLVEGKWARRKDNAGNAPILFILPWNAETLPFVRESGQASIICHAESPFEISPFGISYSIPNAKGGASPQSASLAGFRGLRLFDKNSACVFDLEKSVSSILESNELRRFEGISRIEFKRREIFFTDMIKGELAKPLDSMKDFIIERSDGTPVFHLANVCDDISQKVSHIVRGDDHVENTYRHIFLFASLGAPIPRYAHLPMIVNQSGKPYSKRDGDAYVGDFRTKGFLPDALFNYLALLGWSPGDDREKMTVEEMIRDFGIERIKSSPAQFDMNKLLNMNGHYIAEMPSANFAKSTFEMLSSEAGWDLRGQEELFGKVAALMQSRTKTLKQPLEWKYFFFDDYEKDQKAIDKNLKKPEIFKAFASLEKELAELPGFSAPEIEKAIRKAEISANIPEGKLNQALRIAVSGKTTGAGIYETMELLGKDRSISRIKEYSN